VRGGRGRRGWLPFGDPRTAQPSKGPVLVLYLVPSQTLEVKASRLRQRRMPAVAGTRCAYCGTHGLFRAWGNILVSKLAAWKPERRRFHHHNNHASVVMTMKLIIGGRHLGGASPGRLVGKNRRPQAHPRASGTPESIVFCSVGCGCFALTVHQFPSLPF